MNKNAITNIAKGKEADHDTDHAIMKICCDKTTPITCCQNTISDFKNNPTYSFLNGMSSNVQRDSVCASPEVRFNTNVYLCMPIFPTQQNSHFLEAKCLNTLKIKLILTCTKINSAKNMHIDYVNSKRDGYG